MSADGNLPNTQPEGRTQTPTFSNPVSSSPSTQNTTPPTTIPLSAVTRPSIQPHQGQPGKSSSSGGSGHSAIHSSSGSPQSAGQIHKLPKPQNVFSNDGSFLERFQRLKREEDEKRKQQELLERKKQFADRFKNRGKRSHSDVSESSGSGEPMATGSASGSGSVGEDGALSPETPSKKAKLDESPSTSVPQPKPLNEYQREMQNINTESLKGDGVGVRPLTK